LPRGRGGALPVRHALERFHRLPGVRSLRRCDHRRLRRAERRRRRHPRACRQAGAAGDLRGRDRRDAPRTAPPTLDPADAGDRRVTDVLMPALSPTMEEGTLAKWHVKVGDEVHSGDVIAEIETDKATMEVEAVDEGVVEALLVPEGTEEVKVNTPIARLSGGNGADHPS